MAEIVGNVFGMSDLGIRISPGKLIKKKPSSDAEDFANIKYILKWG